MSAAVAVSLLLHAIALWALWRASRRGEAAGSERPAPVEITVIEHARAQRAPAAPPAPAAPRSQAPAASGVPRALVRAQAAHPSAGHGARPPLPAGPPGASPGGHGEIAAGGPPADAPRELVLDAPLRSFGAADGGGYDPGGETIVGMPAPEAPALRAERARQAVNGWLADGAAEDRVEEGLVDDYYRSVGKSVEKAFADTEKRVHVKRGKGMVGAESAMMSYFDTASRYAATGSPTERNTDIEDMQARYGLGPASVGPDPGRNQQQQPVMGAGSALGFFDGSSGGLTVIVELRQKGDGKLASVKLKRSSSDPDFDAWVLAEIPEGLATLPPPPASGAGLHKDGLRSVWAFTGKVSYMRKIDEVNLKDDWWYLPAAAALAMVGGHFDVSGSAPEMIDLRHPHFVVTSKLLGVY